MLTKIREGMSGKKVAEIIDGNFGYLENKQDTKFAEQDTFIDNKLTEYEEQLKDIAEKQILEVDKEDLTNEAGIAKFADRQYTADSNNGMGYKILRRRKYNGTNLLVQADFDSENTIYVIRYDFDLAGLSITIPDGCTLDFLGGSFKNGVIEGNNTRIKASLEKIFNTHVILGGIWNIDKVYPEWFGDFTGESDFTEPLQKAISICSITGATLILENKYYISSTLDVSNVTKIQGKGFQYPNKYDDRTYQGVVVGDKWFMDHDYPYSFFMERFTGSCIFSDKPITLLKWSSGRTIALKDFIIVGSFNVENQLGFGDTENPTEYNGSTIIADNFAIMYSGGDGMRLRRGCEYFNWNSVNISNNAGYGLYIDRSFTQNPCDYSQFTECTFDNNFLDGVYLKGLRSGLNFQSCNLSRNGQYQLASSSTKNRVAPSAHENLKSGIRVTSVGAYSGQNLTLANCFAEQTQCMITFNITNSFNEINILGCQLQALERTSAELLYPSALVVLSGNYIADLIISNNFIKRTESYVLFDTGVAYSENWKISGRYNKTNTNYRYVYNNYVII